MLRFFPAPWSGRGVWGGSRGHLVRPYPSRVDKLSPALFHKGREGEIHSAMLAYESESVSIMWHEAILETVH